MIKNAIKEAILEGDIPNEIKAAKKLMIQVAADMGLQPVTKG